MLFLFFVVNMITFLNTILILIWVDNFQITFRCWIRYLRSVIFFRIRMAAFFTTENRHFDNHWCSYLIKSKLRSITGYLKSAMRTRCNMYSQVFHIFRKTSFSSVVGRLLNISVESFTLRAVSDVEGFVITRGTWTKGWANTLIFGNNC